MTIRLLTSNKELFIVHSQKGRLINASILYEVPSQKRNEGHQEHNYEEWQAGDSGCLPCMWNQDVQDRKESKLVSQLSGLLERLGICE